MSNQTAGRLKSHYLLYNKVYITMQKEEFGFLNMFYIMFATDMFCL